MRKSGRSSFTPLPGDYEWQAELLFSQILPDALARMTGLRRGQIAVLYPAAWIGDAVADAAREYGFDIIRTDSNALYPRSSLLMRWTELCAIWCCGGWRNGNPRVAKIVAEGQRIFLEALISQEARRTFMRTLLALLWDRRDSTLSLNSWLDDLKEGLIDDLVKKGRTLDDEAAIFDAFLRRTMPDGDAADLTLGQFSGYGDGNDRINLSTLHSAKGREFPCVVLFGMDDRRIPRNRSDPAQQREARRLFYVGFTRAERELHIVHSAGRPSPFVLEVQNKLEE